METFSDKLNAAMKKVNFSQAQLSRLTGITKGSISQYCAGNTIPSEKRQRMIAECLGLKSEYFFENDVRKALTEKFDRKIPRLSVKEAASLMGIHDTTVAFGLQEGVFPWGYAIHGRGEKWVYWINAVKFAEIEGIDLEKIVGGTMA